MYFRSAPLQQTPRRPCSTTTRICPSRAHCRPARRRSCAVATSSELKRSARSMVMTPTAPARSTWMCVMPTPDLRRVRLEPDRLWSTYAWQQFALGLGDNPTAETGVEHDHAAMVGGADPDDR